MKRKLFLLYGVCLCLSSFGGTKPVVLHDTLEEVCVAREYAHYFVDTTCLYTVEQVSQLRSNDFKQSHEDDLVNTDGYAAYWLRFQVKNTSEETFLVELFDFDIDQVTFYLEQEDGSFESHLAGFSLPFAERYLPHKNLCFPLRIPKGDQRTVYMRFVSSRSNVLEPIVRSEYRFVHYSIREYVFLGILCGLLILIVFYNQLYFIFLRKSHFSYYSLFVLGVLLYLMTINGTGFQFIWGNHPRFNAQASHLALFLIVACMLLYTQRVLLAKSGSKWSLFIVGLVIVRLLFLGVQLTARPHAWWETVDLFFLQTPMVICARMLLRGDRNVKWFFIAYLLFDSCFVITYLEHHELLASNVFTVYALSFGTVLQFVFLSFNYGESIKRTFIIKDVAQTELIAQFKRNEELQTSLTKELEKKVAERTKELEIKNREMEKQKEEIQALNDNLEELVKMRTTQLEDRNNRIREYAFSNSHLVRGPLARILGLVYLAQNHTETIPHLAPLIHENASDLDKVIKEMTKILEEN